MHAGSADWSEIKRNSGMLGEVSGERSPSYGDIHIVVFNRANQISGRILLREISKHVKAHDIAYDSPARKLLGCGREPIIDNVQTDSKGFQGRIIERLNRVAALTARNKNVARAVIRSGCLG